MQSYGIDNKGSKYPSIDEMWQIELKNKKSNEKIVQPIGSQQNWYNNANKYWDKVQPTNNGVLGGYGNLSSKDVKYSLQFIVDLCKSKPNFKRNSVLDCGAGIGRISLELLCQVFKTVDLIDQCQKLIIKAKQLLKDKNARHFYVEGLQSFQFQEKYDCVWIQWVLCHLTDQAAIDFLKRAKQALNQGGVIIVKQNHCVNGFSVDKQDCSVTRSRALYLDLFQKAGLKVIVDQKQTNWPQDLYSVRMYALE